MSKYASRLVQGSIIIHVSSISVWLRCDRRVTKVGRVGPMFKGKTPPVREDKHRFYKRGLKGRVVVCRCSGLRNQGSREQYWILLSLPLPLTPLSLLKNFYGEFIVSEYAASNICTAITIFVAYGYSLHIAALSKRWRCFNDWLYANSKQPKCSDDGHFH